MRRALLVVLVELGLIAASSAQEPSRYDVVIRGGRVLDGTGNPFFHADVAIYDPVTVRNRSTDARPHAYSEGIGYVLINGKLAVDAGELTGALAGEVLTPRTSGRPTSN